MEDVALEYDNKSKDSILAHARKLLGHSLRELYPEAKVKSGGRGGLGQAVEEYHFHYENNSESAPDFAEAGLELKCSPLKVLVDQSVVAKERLVLNIINYCEEFDKKFETSSFWKKNEHLLLMYYLHKQGVSREDFLFKLIRNWKIPAADLRIFQNDWQTIHNKIVAGRAHELHEGDTFYLAACEKGSSSGAEMREQVGTDTKAQQRAYSIKACYMNQVILDSLVHPEMIHDLSISSKRRSQILRKRMQIESIVRHVDDYNENETFESLVSRLFQPYLGKSGAQIAKQFGLKYYPSDYSVGGVTSSNIGTSPGARLKGAKNFWSVAAMRMLGVNTDNAAEFVKAGVVVKTIRVEANNTIRESMSFPALNLCQLAGETWESSQLRELLAETRFLFVVFKREGFDYYFKGAWFWNMPHDVLETMVRRDWVKVQDVVKSGVVLEKTDIRTAAGYYLVRNNLPGSADTEVAHVRNHARKTYYQFKDGSFFGDKTYGDRLPSGEWMTIQSWWLNKNYVVSIINQLMETKEVSEHSGILDSIGNDLAYIRYLPIYSQKAACGKFGGQEVAELEGWVRVEGLRKRNKNLYVVRAIGHSMEPVIANGEFKVFEYREGSCDSGDIVLAEHSGIMDSESHGAYSIKKFWEQKSGAVRVKAKLIPVNRDYEVIELLNEGEYIQSYRIVGVLRNDIRVVL